MSYSNGYEPLPPPPSDHVERPRRLGDPESAVDAAIAAQSAAAESRDAVTELLAIERARARPARPEIVTMGEISQAGVKSRPYTSRGGLTQPTRSFALLNYSPATLYIGIGGASAKPNAEAFSVDGGQYLVLPWDVGDVEVDADPTTVLSSPGLFFVLIRFPSVQPFAAGSLSTDGGAP